MPAPVSAAWLRPNLVDRLLLRLEDAQGALTFHVFLDLDGDLDRAALAAALGDTIADFPILASRIRRGHWGYGRVAVAPGIEDPADLVAWRPGTDEGEETAFVQAPLDVAATAPVRLLVRPHGGGTRLVAKIHHSAMDGVGAFLWLDQLARRYGERVASRAPAPAPMPEPTRSYAQYVWALGWRDRLAVLSRGADALTGFFLGNGTGTGGPNADYATFLDEPPPGRGQVRWAVATLDAGRVAALKAWTRAHGGTMNDLLFAAFATTAARRWPSSRPVVAHIPVNLRTGAPAGVFNRVADVRVELDPADLSTFEAAFRATLAVTPRARDRLQAIARIFERYLASHFPRKAFARLVGAYMDRPRNGIMTFDFSNLGALGALPSDFGAARVAGGWLVGPQSVPPGLGCYVTTIRGALGLCVGYMHPSMRHESARALVDGVAALLTGLVEPPAAARPAAPSDASLEV